MSPEGSSLHRLLATLLLPLLLLLCACDPEQNPQAPGPATTGLDSIWLVLTTDQGSFELTSHTFKQWDGGPGLCSVMRSYYAGSPYTWDEVQAAWGELQELQADVEAAEQDPELRRDYCGAISSYYSMYNHRYYANGDALNGRKMTSVVLHHPEAAGYEPVAGTYLSVVEEEVEGAAEGRFSGWWTRYVRSPSEDLEAIDCDAYAADPDAELFAEPMDYEEFMVNHHVIGGSLEASRVSDTAWRLTLPDGIAAQADGFGPLDGSEEEVAFSFEGTFERCDVTMNWGTFAE